MTKPLEHKEPAEPKKTSLQPEAPDENPLSRFVKDLYGPKESHAQATIPSELERPTIQKMRVGESVFTTPWSLRRDKDGNFWLPQDSTLDSSGGGTAESKVTRTRAGCKMVLFSGSNAPGNQYPEEAKQMLGELKNDRSYIPAPGDTKVESVVGGPIAWLGIGDSAITVPWMLSADKNGKLWLDTHGTTSEEPCGTMTMKVTRTKEGFDVDFRGKHPEYIDPDLDDERKTGRYKPVMKVSGDSAVDKILHSLDQ
jgi:hypothetical protein